MLLLALLFVITHKALYYIYYVCECVYGICHD